MSPGPIERLSRRRPTKWAVWRFNWLAHHKIIRALERARGHARGTLLDVGCGTRAFAPLFEGRVERYLGVDLVQSRFVGDTPPDAWARAEALPFRDGCMDTVMGLSMLTYLPEPSDMLREAHRVLRPGGVLLLEFTQMAPLHDAPHDYLRFTRYGAAALLERTGFEPVDFIPIGGLWSRVGLSLIGGLNRINRGPWRVLTELPVRVLYVVIQLGCELLERITNDPDEVLAHLVVGRRVDAAGGASGPAR